MPVINPVHVINLFPLKDPIPLPSPHNRVLHFTSQTNLELIINNLVKLASDPLSYEDLHTITQVQFVQEQVNDLCSDLLSWTG